MAIMQTETYATEDWLDYWVTTSCDNILQDPRRSTIVYGVPGSGKSTALRMMQKALRHEILDVPLVLDQLYMPSAPTDQTQLFSAIRAAVARRFADLIRAEPAFVAHLTDLTGQFLRWLLSIHLRPRELRVLIERSSTESLRRLFEQADENLYPTFDRDSIRSQFDEMALLAAGLGYKKVVLILDAPPLIAASDIAIIKALIGWLDLWQQRDFVIKGALPKSVVQAEQLDTLARGRIEFAAIRWTVHACDLLASRWLAPQMANDAADMQSLAEASLYWNLSQAAVDIHGEPTPRGWIGLANILYNRWQATRKQLTEAADSDMLRQDLYRSQAPLRLDSEHQGVWRGAQFITLTPQPYRVLETLWRFRGGESRAALLHVTGSANNLYRQIRLLRESVEPLPSRSKAWIYICMESGGNYVLEGAAYDSP